MPAHLIPAGEPYREMWNTVGVVLAPCAARGATATWRDAPAAENTHRLHLLVWKFCMGIVGMGQVHVFERLARSCGGREVPVSCVCVRELLRLHIVCTSFGMWAKWDKYHFFWYGYHS